MECFLGKSLARWGSTMRTPGDGISPLGALTPFRETGIVQQLFGSKISKVTVRMVRWQTEENLILKDFQNLEVRLKKKKKVKGRVNYEAKVKRIKGHDIIKESQKARVRRRGADSTKIRKSGRI